VIFSGMYLDWAVEKKVGAKEGNVIKRARLKEEVYFFILISLFWCEEESEKNPRRIRERNEMPQQHFEKGFDDPTDQNDWFEEANAEEMFWFLA
jgi:hypothetical protein